ncbi:uncharacterized protein ACN2A1_013026 isoform 3-T9 [Glossina fuscipes fuscipes]
MSLRRGCVYGRNEVTGVFTNKKCLAFKAILYAEFQDIWQHSLKYIAGFLFISRNKKEVGLRKTLRRGARQAEHQAPQARFKKKKGAERRNEERRSNCRVQIYDIKLSDLSAAEIITLQRNGAETKKISK